jgi:hypothetical protein
MTSGWPCNGTCNGGIYLTLESHFESFNLIGLVCIVEWINNITNFIGHNLAIIVVRNLFFIGSYGIYMSMSFIYLYYLNIDVKCTLFKHNIICLFMLIRHKNCAHDFHV